MVTKFGANSFMRYVTSTVDVVVASFVFVCFPC